MGISGDNLRMLIKLKEGGYLPNQGAIIEIGAQQLANSFLSNKQELAQIRDLFKVTDSVTLSEPTTATIVHGAYQHQEASAPRACEFWKWLGYQYASIDIDGSPGSIPLDLNYDDVPEQDRGKYHLVTNFGTTEHIANQLNAFKVIHDLTALGGIMIHDLPAQGLFNHGLINYNPKFFWMLARSNRYKWLYIDYLSDMAYYELPPNIVEGVEKFNRSITTRAKAMKAADCSIVVALQKIYDSPYVPPLDVQTGTKPTHSILEERYWSIFHHHAFSQYTRHIDPFFKRATRLFRRISNRLRG